MTNGPKLGGFTKKKVGGFNDEETRNGGFNGEQTKFGLN